LAVELASAIGPTLGSLYYLMINSKFGNEHVIGTILHRDAMERRQALG
jgi:hypothetical protein